MRQLTNMLLITNEVSIKNNNLPAGPYKVAPKFTRNISKHVDGRSAVELVAEITNTEENPFPVDIRVSMTGIFDTRGFKEEEVDSFLKINAVQILFPYIRTTISNITSGAFMAPIILPVVDVLSLFQEE